jgi:anti-sigma regulatory factor (Ser/Thr protein kinase)
MAGAPFRLKLRATPDAVTKARHELTKVAGEFGADPLAVKVVVSELVGNAVQHAYADGEPGWVLIRARSSPDWLLMTVADDGCGMKPLPEDGCDGLGLGLRLSIKLTAQLHVEATGRGTTVVARFPLPDLDVAV